MAGSRERGPTPWVIGTIDTAAGPVSLVTTDVDWHDVLGHWRVRWGFGRYRYRIEPGLYAVGEPGPDAPVLVTANYKLSFDALRGALGGLDAWVLVLDTKGINVWCAAGKGTFGTKELAERVLSTKLSEVVDHRVLVLPQLGAPGVASQVVPKLCGFSVVFGPIRAGDVGAFLAAGMKATPGMRVVTFTLKERLILTPVELSLAWSRWSLALVAAVVLIAAAVGHASGVGGVLAGAGRMLAPPAAGLVFGAFVTPVLLPWIPGRSFAFKGALAGIVGAALLVAGYGHGSLPGTIGLLSGVPALSSFAAMNFTGSTPFTSLSGVKHEMQRALPWQVAGGAVWLIAMAASLVIR
jgi:hypothetical protein